MSGTETPPEARCESNSPIYKFDEGPRRCRGPKGHEGPHYAKTSDGRYVDPQYDNNVTWEDRPLPARNPATTVECACGRSNPGGCEVRGCYFPSGRQTL